MPSKPIEYGFAIIIGRRPSIWPLDDARPRGIPTAAKLKVVLFDHVDERIGHRVNLLRVKRRIDLEGELETILAKFTESAFLPKPLLQVKQISIDERVNRYSTAELR
jgi:hypothetical protein